MGRKKASASRFSIGDQVLVRHSYKGLCENLIATVECGLKNRKHEILISVNERTLWFPTKYLDFLNPERLSKEFDIGDLAKVIRAYCRFLQNSIVKVISNYLDDGQRIIVEDDRAIVGPIPQRNLKFLARP